MARMHRTIKMGLNLDNNDGMIAHLEPDILDSEVR